MLEAQAAVKISLQECDRLLIFVDGSGEHMEKDKQIPGTWAISLISLQREQFSYLGSFAADVQLNPGEADFFGAVRQTNTAAELTAQVWQFELSWTP